MRMRSNADNYYQSCNEANGSNIPDGVLESLNSLEDGSNAIILPGRKKNKLKMKDKKARKKELPTLSKSKEKKLRLLEEEKRKKLLLAKSFKMLEKHKLQDAVHSVLHSSGTIGQVETFKGKRLRAVKLSRAGVQVRDDMFSVEGMDKKSSYEDETLLEANSVQHHNGILVDKIIPQTSCRQSDDDMTLDVVSPSTEVREENGVSCMIVDQKHSLTITCSHEAHDNKAMVTILDNMPAGSNGKHEEIEEKTDVIVHKHDNRATVVHVSRPNVVEEQRKDLPIIMMEQEIMEAINENFIVILCGETGCGKTTQVPQFLYEAGYGSSDRSDRKGIIGVTQPHRVAVLATAKRVSFELGLSLGKEIGFQVRHDKLIGKSCSIKFMTDGILLRELQSDFLLKRYSVIILDEAHERSLNTDILCGVKIGTLGNVLRPFQIHLKLIRLFVKWVLASNERKRSSLITPTIREPLIKRSMIRNKIRETESSDIIYKYDENT